MVSCELEKGLSDLESEFMCLSISGVKLYRAV